MDMVTTIEVVGSSSSYYEIKESDLITSLTIQRNARFGWLMNKAKHLAIKELDQIDVAIITNTPNENDCWEDFEEYAKSIAEEYQ